MPSPAIPALTFLDLATDALVTIGEVGAGEPISAEDSAYCLQRANGMIDSWSIDRTYIFSETIQAYALAAAKKTFSMGPANADIVGVRPAQISKARILVSVAGVYVGVKDLDIVSADEFQEFSDPTASALVPEKMWCDFAMPNANLNFYPGVSAATVANGIKVELQTWSPLTQFAAINTVLVLPPGLYEALVTNLGVAICPGYNKAPDPVLVARAQATLARYKSLNFLNSGALPPQPQGAEAQGQTA